MREALTRDRVLEAAVALADAEGLGAVTMRGLGARLDVEAMSLYHHVRGKEALLDGLAECLLGEVAAEIDAALAAIPQAGWQEIVTTRCLAARRVMLRHPWGPGLISSRETIPFGAYQLFEQAMGAMIEGGIGYHLGHRALHSLGSMLVGFTQELFSPASAGGDLDEEQAEAEFAAMAAMVPHLAAMIASEVHSAGDDTLGWCDSQSEFEFTLDLLLSGLQRAADKERSGGGSEATRSRPDPGPATAQA